MTGLPSSSPLPPGQFAVWAGIAAAMLFGIAAPLAKVLLGACDPWILAGLLYLGSGLGLGLPALLRRSGHPIRSADVPWLAGAVLFGGIIAPVLLMIGLRVSDGAAASLLLTTEGVFTAGLARFCFGEHIDRRIALGMAVITAGAMVLAWAGSPILPGAAKADIWATAWPCLAILAACLCWGIDNNLTRKVSLSDPVTIASLKGLTAGSCNLVLGMTLAPHLTKTGGILPSFTVMALAAIVGFVGYGVSLVLYVLSLRGLGAARAGAYFATAPLVGAVLSLPLLGEQPSLRLGVAALLMGWGLWLHLTERHSHDHLHAELVHDHLHDHQDSHHTHHHEIDEIKPVGPHSHLHHHHPLRHAHPHYPDAHHRHGHKNGDTSAQGEDSI